MTMLDGGNFGGQLCYGTKLIFKPDQEFDKNYPCMEFGGNLVISD